MMFNATTVSDGTTKAEVEYIIQNSYPNTEIIILSVILSIFCVLGTVGNALAFVIYYRKREKGTSTIFILSLAVTDFLTCLINLPYTIISLLLEYRLEYDVLCKIFLYIGTFNVPLSSLIMVAIGIDRYLCICHPFLHIVTVTRAKVCVIVLTLMSALLGIVPALSHAVYRKTDHMNQPTSSNESMPTSGSLNSNYTRDVNDTNSTHLFTNGIYQPTVEFMSNFVLQEAALNYNTKTSEILSSTLAPAKRLPSSNVTTSVYTHTMTRIFINDSSSSSSSSAAEDDAYFEGVCVESEHILSKDFVTIYLRIYAGSYLFEFIVLALLYALIYRSILVRRAWKTKRKRMSCYTSTHCQETIAEETQLTNINGGVTETIVLKKNHGRFSSAMRDRALHANIKTAAMLFVVTVGFVISFLPSWLMGLRAFDIQISVFYMFYINNVINPFIYAFMNRAFRDDLFQLLKSMFRR